MTFHQEVLPYIFSFLHLHCAHTHAIIHQEHHTFQYPCEFALFSLFVLLFLSAEHQIILEVSPPISPSLQTSLASFLSYSSLLQSSVYVHILLCTFLIEPVILLYNELRVFLSCPKEMRTMPYYLLPYQF